MERIICVDDDPLCLLLGEFVIRQTKIAKETILVESGSEALLILNKLLVHDKEQFGFVEPSTLIFLDINMPGMNGWDFLEIFEAKYQHLLPQVKIVMLSSSIDPEDITKSKQYKAVASFISKPLTVKAVNQLQIWDVNTSKVHE